MTLNVWPPTVIVPVRGVVTVFACTLKVRSDVPVPPPCPSSIHGTDLEADQAQPAWAVTVNRPAPPSIGKLWDPGFSVKVHATAVCRTVTVSPASVSVPVRAAPGLAATLTVIVAAPVPAGAEVITSQFAVLAADQAQVGPMAS